MTQHAPTVHPDDFLFFGEVVAAMKVVAKQYDLPLREVVGHPDCHHATSPLGDCGYDGRIRLVMRGKTATGEWDAEPRHPDSVWKTAAHELAHLKHMNHGVAFQELEVELHEAIRNRTTDHRERVIARLVKMQASRDGEAKLGNMEAAEAFASAINRMLLEYELSPSTLDYARTQDNDPVIEIRVDLLKYKVTRKRSRIAWQESLARIVARAHLCSFLICPGSNQITFVGTRSHAMVAEYVWGTLVPAVDSLALHAYYRYLAAARKDGGRGEAAHGFRESWLNAFLQRISERFDEARKAALASVPTDAPGSTSTGLMRLDGALVKVQQYVDTKFARKRRYAAALNGGSNGYHEDAHRLGREAADRIVLGRRGVTGGTVPKRLGS